MHNLVVSLFLCACAFAHAQSPMQIVMKMNATYAAAKSYSMHVNMNMYMGTNDVTPISSGKGIVHKSGEMYFSSIMGKTTICNKECTVFIDEGQKQILYNRNPKAKNPNHQKNSEIPDTSEFGRMAKYSFGVGNETSTRIVVIPAEQLIYKKIELLINKTTFALEELVYYYSDNKSFTSPLSIVRITYSSIQLNNSIPLTQFSEKNYVVRKAGTLTGTGNYASYEVIEQKNEWPIKN